MSSTMVSLQKLHVSSSSSSSGPLSLSSLEALLDAFCDAHKQYVGIKRILENIHGKLTHGIDCTPSRRDSRLLLPLSCCLARALLARRVLRSLGLLALSAHKLLQLFHSIFSLCRRFSAGCLPPKKKDQKGLWLLDLIYFLFWVSELG